MIWLVGKEKKFTPPKIPKKHGEEGKDEKPENGWDGGHPPSPKAAAGRLDRTGPPSPRLWRTGEMLIRCSFFCLVGILAQMGEKEELTVTLFFEKISTVFTRCYAFGACFCQVCFLDTWAENRSQEMED
jgi:hypothetical protein